MAKTVVPKRIKYKPKPRAGALDAEIGRRLRAMRLQHGMSQSVLGQHLGVTFQQVQKYENGANRIGAGRLQGLAEIFAVAISDFFPERKHLARKPTLFDLAVPRDALVLLRACTNLRDRRLRRYVVQLVDELVAAGR